MLASPHSVTEHFVYEVMETIPAYYIILHIYGGFVLVFVIFPVLVM